MVAEYFGQNSLPQDLASQATDGAERAADVIFKINDFLDTTMLEQQTVPRWRWREREREIF